MGFREKLKELFEEQEAGKESYIFDFELCSFVDEHLLPHKNQIPVLYRYSPADYNNIRALEKQTMFLSESGKMNDVFEGLSCGLADDKDLDSLDSLHDLAYLKSFTENADDLVMWGTYADNYAGMCVSYDCKNFFDKSLYYHLFPVRYSDQRKTKAILRFAAQNLLDLKQAEASGNVPEDVDWIKDIMPLFISKSKKWRHEREWRLIVTYLQMHTQFGDYENDIDTKPLYDINSQTISFPYAKEVFLGPRMRKNVKEHIQEIGSKLDIPVYEMMLEKDKYALVKKPCESL